MNTDPGPDHSFILILKKMQEVVLFLENRRER